MAAGDDALRRIRQAKQALAQALEAACIAYANGGQGQASPIVDDRFKGGGNRRFAPLTPRYASAKAGRSGRLRQALKAAGRVVPKGAGTLPILVRSGVLRQRVAMGRAHRITLQPDQLRATILFINLPGYAIYHHTGTPKMVQRSPVAPNAADLARFKEVMLRVLRMRLGKAAGAKGTDQ